MGFSPGTELTLADIGEMLRALEQKIATVGRDVTHQREFNSVLIAVVAQHGDPTHLTVDAAARVKSVSRGTIRRRIASGEYTLETIPGTRQTGIPIEQIYSGWMPLRKARQITRDQTQNEKG